MRRYLAAFRACYESVELNYASKANSTLAVLAIAASEGLMIDVASEGELRAALAAGVPAERCHLHGNNKGRDEILFAIEQGIGQIVVDHFGELETIAEISAARGGLGDTELVLRLAPGVDPITHEKISTGQADTKFGFNIADGSAERALRRCLDLGLPLVGFHCHVGSQLLDPEAQRAAGELLGRFAVRMKQHHGFETRHLNVGGGLGVAYGEGDEPMEVEEYCRLVVQSTLGAIQGSGLKPTLAQEPGRALVAESGVTLYRVGVVKSVPANGIGTRTYVSVDGGLADNPRPALYGSRYPVERVSRATSGTETHARRAVTVCGRHCEADTLFEVRLPADIGPGDLIQVLATGAYNASMASNYNRYPRPATVLIREADPGGEGEAVLVQRREAWEEMLAREILPEGLAR
jgi:diaminopimelate decarboxylase